jgi:hypothetical protein
MPNEPPVEPKGHLIADPRDHVRIESLCARPMYLDKLDDFSEVSPAYEAEHDSVQQLISPPPLGPAFRQSGETRNWPTHVNSCKKGITAFHATLVH